LCLFWKNGNTKNQKILSLQSFSNICIIITYTCPNQKSNHALTNPLNTLTMYSLPTLSSFYPKPKRRIKRPPPRSLTYWSILAVEATSKIKKIVQKMAFNNKDWHEMIPLLYMGIVLQYAFRQGQSPSFPQYTTWRSRFP